MTEEAPPADADHRALFEALSACCAALDASLRIVAASDAFCEVTLTDREEILGRDIFDVFPDSPDHGDGALTLSGMLDRALGERTTVEHPGLRYDIERPASEGGGFVERVWRATITPRLGPAGEVANLLLVTEDVTERTRLSRQRDEQRELLSARAQELHLVNQALKEADEAKNHFLSRMSHELRTPLNSVLGFAQVLQRDELSDDQRASVDHIVRAGRHLLALIDEVLQISRIEAGTLALSIEPVAVAALVGEAMSLMQPLAAAHEVTMAGPPLQQLDGAFVAADAQRSKQVLLNLLSNAVKYNRSGGRVEVTASREGDHHRITVTDDGPGIDPAMAPLVFVPFERLGAEGGPVEGTGIGLALARSLAEAMGGHVDFCSPERGGAAFWLDLPAADVPGHAEASPETASERGTARAGGRPGPPTRRRPIVCIEDNELNIRLIERILRGRSDVELVHAPLGRAGIEAVRRRPDAIVLLDLHLPDLSGEDVLAALRAHPATAAVPVVVLSADAMPGRVERVLEAGATDYLTKPLDLDRFTALLDELLDTAEG